MKCLVSFILLAVCLSHVPVGNIADLKATTDENVPDLVQQAGDPDYLKLSPLAGRVVRSASDEHSKALDKLRATFGPGVDFDVRDVASFRKSPRFSSLWDVQRVDLASLFLALSEEREDVRLLVGIAQCNDRELIESTLCLCCHSRTVCSDHLLFLLSIAGVASDKIGMSLEQSLKQWPAEISDSVQLHGLVHIFGNTLSRKKQELFALADAFSSRSCIQLMITWMSAHGREEALGVVEEWLASRLENLNAEYEDLLGSDQNDAKAKLDEWIQKYEALGADAVHCFTLGRKLTLVSFADGMSRVSKASRSYLTTSVAQHIDATLLPACFGDLERSEFIEGDEAVAALESCIDYLQSSTFRELEWSSTLMVWFDPTS